MKKFVFPLLIILLAMTSCNNANNNIVFNGYKIGEVSNVGFGTSGLTASVIVDLDLTNPGAAPYTLENFNATLYKLDGKEFATLTSDVPATIAGKSTATVQVPISLVFSMANAMSMAIGSIGDFDPNEFVADFDARVKKGAFSRHIVKKKVPIKEIARILSEKSEE